MTASLAGAYASRLLADLGADVSRLGDTRGLARSISTRAFPDWMPGLHHVINAGKTPVASDPSDPTHAGTLRRMAADADLVFEDVGLVSGSGAPITVDELRIINPALHVVSVSPFGSDGLYPSLPASDLTLWALSGLAWTSPGIPDTVSDLPHEPPLSPTGISIASLMGGTVAAAAALSLLWRKSDIGHDVEVAEIEALVALNYHPIAQFEYLRRLWARGPNIIARQPNCYVPCADGWLVLVAMSPRHWVELLDAMGNPEWSGLELFQSAPSRAANWDALEPLITEWTRARSGQEITRELQARGLPVYWSTTLPEAIASPQVRERGSLRTLNVPGKAAMSYPGLPFILSRHPRAGRTPAESRVGTLAARPAGLGAATQGSATGSLPLQGVRVIDFGQYIAAPFAAKWLAALGADVVHVESSQNPFDYRVVPPFADDVGGMNRAAGYNVLNAGKRSIALNLRTQEGQSVARRLSLQGDVLIENYSTGMMSRWGLGYMELAVDNPRLIYTSIAAFGRTGPLKDYGGLHSIVNAFSGLADVTGYAGGGHPRILGSYFPDVVSGTYAVLATLAALRDREVSSQGQFIDLAMTECLMTLLTEPIFSHSIGDHAPNRDGNHHPRHAPHNVYRCAGDDQWIAIAIRTDAEWRGLCEAMGRMDWQGDNRFAAAAGRKSLEPVLDDGISAWASHRTKEDIAASLVQAGVPAAPVLNPREVVENPHLSDRGFIAAFDHPEVGSRRGASIPWRVDGAIAGKRRPAPLAGQYHREVLKQWLGMPDADIQSLEDAGVLE